MLRVDLPVVDAVPRGVASAGDCDAVAPGSSWRESVDPNIGATSVQRILGAILANVVAAPGHLTVDNEVRVITRCSIPDEHSAPDSGNGGTQQLTS